MTWGFLKPCTGRRISCSSPFLAGKKMKVPVSRVRWTAAMWCRDSCVDLLRIGPRVGEGTVGQRVRGGPRSGILVAVKA